ncbi:MAG: hypothetical protein LBI43_05395 [Streptococcaceae bacterium]|jgi:hypothetical protein|nr:hypothetical protein [Streptococcaceae bacterium]
MNFQQIIDVVKPLKWLKDKLDKELDVEEKNAKTMGIELPEGTLKENKESEKLY